MTRLDVMGSFKSLSLVWVDGRSSSQALGSANGLERREKSNGPQVTAATGPYVPSCID